MTTERDRPWLPPHEQAGAQRARHLHQVHHAAVKRAGWDEMTQIREEVSFTKGRIIVRGKLVTRGKAKRADYVLYYKPNIPLALIEAKDNNHSVGDGMQQAPRLRRRRSTFRSSSPRTATASCSTTAPAQSADIETNLALDAFPSPADSVGALPRLEGPDAGAGADRPSGLLRRRQRQGAALLPGQRRQRRDRGHRQGPEPRAARHGDRHRQDLHRLPDHLAALEGGPQEAHPVPRRPQRADRPDDGQRLPPLRRGDGEAQHQTPRPSSARTAPTVDLPLALDKKRRIDTAYEIYLGLYQAITGPEERQKLFREFSPGFFDLIVDRRVPPRQRRRGFGLAGDPRYFSVGHPDRPDRHAEGNEIRLQHRLLRRAGLHLLAEAGHPATASSRRTRSSRSTSTATWKATGPEPGKLDRDGNEVEDRIYNQKDFDRTLVLDDRTKLVAKKVTEFLKESGDRFQKTIVFCVDNEHAARVPSPRPRRTRRSFSGGWEGGRRRLRANSNDSRILPAKAGSHTGQ